MDQPRETLRLTRSAPSCVRAPWRGDRRGRPLAGGFSQRTVLVAAPLLAALLLTSCAGDRAEPAPRPSTSALSAEDRESIERALASAAENYGLTDPPDVAVVRLVSVADWPSTQVQCMNDAGFSSVTLTPDGTGIDYESRVDQQESMNLALYRCAAQYPTDPGQDESRLTRDQKLVAYTYLTETLVECLAGQGLTITAIPSEDTFLATWDTDRWNPYTQVPASRATDVLQQTCPMNTPPELLWSE